MQPHAEHILELEQAGKYLIGSMVWVIFALLAFSLLKEFIVELIEGFLWRYNSNYEALEIVRVDGNIARISHLGWIKTDFTIFIMNAKKQIVGGWALSVLNAELRHTRIEKYMPLVDIPLELRKAIS